MLSITGRYPTDLKHSVPVSQHNKFFGHRYNAVALGTGSTAASKFADNNDARSPHYRKNFRCPDQIIEKTVLYAFAHPDVMMVLGVNAAADLYEHYLMNNPPDHPRKKVLFDIVDVKPNDMHSLVKMAVNEAADLFEDYLMKKHPDHVRKNIPFEIVDRYIGYRPNGQHSLMDIRTLLDTTYGRPVKSRNKTSCLGGAGSACSEINAICDSGCNGSQGQDLVCTKELKWNGDPIMQIDPNDKMYAPYIYKSPNHDKSAFVSAIQMLEIGMTVSGKNFGWNRTKGEPLISNSMTDFPPKTFADLPIYMKKLIDSQKISVNKDGTIERTLKPLWIKWRLGESNSDVFGNKDDSNLEAATRVLVPIWKNDYPDQYEVKNKKQVIVHRPPTMNAYVNSINLSDYCSVGDVFINGNWASKGGFLLYAHKSICLTVAKSIKFSMSTKNKNKNQAFYLPDPEFYASDLYAPLGLFTTPTNNVVVLKCMVAIDTGKGSGLIKSPFLTETNKDSNFGDIDYYQISTDNVLNTCMVTAEKLNLNLQRNFNPSTANIVPILDPNVAVERMVTNCLRSQKSIEGAWQGFNDMPGKEHGVLRPDNVDAFIRSLYKEDIQVRGYPGLYNCIDTKAEEALKSQSEQFDLYCHSPECRNALSNATYKQEIYQLRTCPPIVVCKQNVDIKNVQFLTIQNVSFSCAGAKPLPDTTTAETIVEKVNINANTNANTNANANANANPNTNPNTNADTNINQPTSVVNPFSDPNSNSVSEPFTASDPFSDFNSNSVSDPESDPKAAVDPFANLFSNPISNPGPFSNPQEDSSSTIATPDVPPPPKDSGIDVSDSVFIKQANTAKVPFGPNESLSPPTVVPTKDSIPKDSIPKDIPEATKVVSKNTSTTTETPGKDSINIGAIVGGCVGFLLLVAIIGFIFLHYKK